MKMKFETIEIGQRLKNGAIVISVTKKGNRAIILALLPKVLPRVKEPYVTWCYEEFCMAGHYFGDLEMALKDYKYRAEGGY
jgi:hypothetical protein